jgi:tetratricopeptide (TPR) repeat protein
VAQFLIAAGTPAGTVYTPGVCRSRHARIVLTCLLAVVTAAGVAPDLGARQEARTWVTDWLNEYAGGAREAVAARLVTVADLGTLEKDLDRASKPWVEAAGADPLARRRVLAAFALEAASARVEAGEAAVSLLEWGCRQVRRIPRARAGDFEQIWHYAAFAVLAGAVAPDAIESHVAHMRFQFPNEPRLPFERAVAQELRAASFYEDGKASAADVRKRLEEAAKRYREAAAEPSVKTEAQVRLGRVELQLGRPAEALAAIDAAGAKPDQRFVAYLSHLFRGQAYEQMKRPDDALQEYERALVIQPGAQSGMLAMASLHFRQGRRTAADAVIDSMFSRTSIPLDPWWIYGPADYRHIGTMLSALRGAIQ